MKLTMKNATTTYELTFDGYDVTGLEAVKEVMSAFYHMFTRPDEARQAPATTAPFRAAPIDKKLGIQIRDGQAMVSSRDIANVFGKDHFNVLAAIKRLAGECSQEFAALNFKAGTYKDANHQKRPLFYLTRDGFTFLAMSFTGKLAASFKEAYINAFNVMGQSLAARELSSGDA